MMFRTRKLLPPVLVLFSWSLMAYSQGTNNGIVPGRVIYKALKGKKGKPIGVDNAKIQSADSKTGRGPGATTDDNGDYTLTQAPTEAEVFVIAATKVENGVIYYG